MTDEQKLKRLRLEHARIQAAIVSVEKLERAVRNAGSPLLRWNDWRLSQSAVASAGRPERRCTQRPLRSVDAAKESRIRL